MLRTLDKLYLRFSNAWEAFKNPEAFYQEYEQGLKLGKQVGYGEVRRTLDLHDPSDFSNNHFKLGYYYAAEQAKKVMQVDEDNLVD